MAAVELLTPSPETETQTGTPKNDLEQEMQSILDQAQKSQEQREQRGPRASHWYYRPVCPGVRYYSF